MENSAETYFENNNAQGTIAKSQYGWWDQFTGADQTTIQNNLFTAEEAEKDRNFNANEAQKQREFEEYMSNTSYQRMMEDAKQAGINPLNLAGTNGASTPTGTAATAGGSKHSAPTGNNFGQILGTIINLIGGVLMKGISSGAQIANTTARNETLKDIAKLNVASNAEKLKETKIHNSFMEDLYTDKEIATQLHKLSNLDKNVWDWYLKHQKEMSTKYRKDR